MNKCRMMLCAIVFAPLAATPAWAQQTGPAADDFKPASTNILGQQYPQVNSARQVRFRINAPQVQSIRVMGTNLVKGEDGVFTGTTAPQDPGFHAYQLNVDGLVVADPASESFFSGGKMTSAIEVPDKGVDFYDLTQLLTLQDTLYTKGMAGFVVGDAPTTRITALFDNLLVTPLDSAKPKPTEFTQDQNPLYKR